MLRRWSRAVFYVVVFLAVWETCARVEDNLKYGVPLLGTDRYTDMLTRDKFGIAGKQNGRYLNFQLNSLGFRGPEPVWNRVRIICIGASETFGVKESPDMEYPRQMERELNSRSAVQYSVINTAIVGQSLGSFARRVDNVVSTVQPNIAVIYPAPSGYIDLPTPHDDSWLEEHPPRFEFRILDRLFAPLERLPLWVRIPRMEFKIWRKTRHIQVMAKLPPSHVERFRADLVHVLDRLQTSGVQPILVTHATRFGAQVSPQEHVWLLAWRTYDPNLSEAGFLDMEERINAVIREEAAARRIKLVDAAKMLDGDDNFADFVHFTDHGAHALACAVADAVASASQSDSLQSIVTTSPKVSGGLLAQTAAPELRGTK